MNYYEYVYEIVIRLRNIYKHNNINDEIAEQYSWEEKQRENPKLPSWNEIVRIAKTSKCKGYCVRTEYEDGTVTLDDNYKKPFGGDTADDEEDDQYDEIEWANEAVEHEMEKLLNPSIDEYRVI
jgi:hypothetical protein